MNELFSPSTIVQLIVAIVALWYTIETQKLRKIAVKQLSLMRQSMSGQIMPFVLSGIIKINDLTDDDEKSKIIEQTSTWDLSKNEIPGITASPNILQNLEDDHVYEVRCDTDELASHVICVFYNHNSRKFKVPPYYLEVIAPRESGYFKMLKDELNKDELCELITKIYEDRSHYLIDKFKKMVNLQESWIIPIFFDLAGRLYATPRKVFLKNNQYQYHKSDLLQPDGYNDVMMPTFESTKEALGE
ncbi:MAG: hypothetical protein WBB45_07715 [Cyclobacteriaceae bacterium]